MQNPRKNWNCLFFPSSTSWSLHLNSNPISCNLMFRGLWKLVSKPLCPSSLWDRTAKVLRGMDLEDLFLATSIFFFFALSFLKLSFLFLRDIPARERAPAEWPAPLLTAWLPQLQKDQKPHFSRRWHLAKRNGIAAHRVTCLVRCCKRHNP